MLDFGCKMVGKGVFCFAKKGREVSHVTHPTAAAAAAAASRVCFVFVRVCVWCDFFFSDEGGGLSWLTNRTVKQFQISTIRLLELQAPAWKM